MYAQLPFANLAVWSEVEHALHRRVEVVIDGEHGGLCGTELMTSETRRKRTLSPVVVHAVVGAAAKLLRAMSASGREESRAHESG